MHDVQEPGYIWLQWCGVVGGLHHQLAHRGLDRTSLLGMEYLFLPFPPNNNIIIKILAK